MKTGLKNALMKIKRTLLCCRKSDRKRSLDIGSPTDVRHKDITETMPNLSEADKRFIGKKASYDAIHIDPFASAQPSPSPPSTHCDPLLNAASTNLPTTLPTPPNHSHSETSPPTRRIKSMWDRTRRLSITLSHRSSVRSSAGYRGLAPPSGHEDAEGVVMLELDLEGKSDGGSVDMDGFEMQRTVGGTSERGNKTGGVLLGERTRNAVEELGEESK